MQREDEKAAEIVKKRRLAAKGIKERADGKPVDPLEGASSLDPDEKNPSPAKPDERQAEIAERAVIAQMGLKR